MFSIKSRYRGSEAPRLSRSLANIWFGRAPKASNVARSSWLAGIEQLKCQRRGVVQH
jgi:hypothetical protein